jgi:hypothetical protein
MTRRQACSSGFVRTLVFGAVAAASLPVSILLTLPVLGFHGALALHGVLSSVGYAVLLSSGSRQRLAVGVVGLAGGLAVAAFSRSPGELLVLLSLGLALVRSGWLLEQRSWRALAVEGVVLVGSLASARFVAAPGLLGSALALWSWFVVQSFYFLVGGLRVRRPSPEGDAFDAARRELLDLLA